MPARELPLPLPTAQHHYRPGARASATAKESESDLGSVLFHGLPSVVIKTPTGPLRNRLRLSLPTRLSTGKRPRLNRQTFDHSKTATRAHRRASRVQCQSCHTAAQMGSPRYKGTPFSKLLRLPSSIRTKASSSNPASHATQTSLPGRKSSFYLNLRPLQNALPLAWQAYRGILRSLGAGG